MSTNPLAEVILAAAVTGCCVDCPNGHSADPEQAAEIADAVRAYLTSDDTVERMRKAIEDELIEWRDAQRFMVCGNGFTVREKDGEPSPIIRFSTDVGLRIALAAATEPQP